MADQVAVLAADEARQLVLAIAAMMINNAGPGVLGEMERAVQETTAVIGRVVLGAVVNLAGQQTPARHACPADAEHSGRLVARRHKTVRTLLGPVPITRGYYHCPACHHGFAPLDHRLGVAGTSLSPGLGRACALAGAEMAYAKSGEFIATVTGLDLTSTSTIGRTTRSQGRRARKLIADELATARPGPIPPAFTSLPDKCYIVMDGTGAPMLPRECEGRQGKNGNRVRFTPDRGGISYKE